MIQLCIFIFIWAASSEFGTYHLCEQRWFRRNLQTESQIPGPSQWLGMSMLKFVMTECSKTQIRLMRLISKGTIDWHFSADSQHTAVKQIHEPLHEKTNKMTSASSEDSYEPGHPPSLIKVFAVHMKKQWVLSYSMSAQQRLWSDFRLIWVLAGQTRHFVGFFVLQLWY